MTKREKIIVGNYKTHDTFYIRRRQTSKRGSNLLGIRNVISATVENVIYEIEDVNW